MGTCRFSVEFNVQGSLLQATRQCELDVLRTWYGDTQELIDQAYSRYADQTVFLAVRESGGDVVGFCRMIRPGVSELLTLHELAAPPWNADVDQMCREAQIDPPRTLDLITMGVRRDLGTAGGVAAAAFYYGVLTAARVNDCIWIMGLLDSRVHRLLRHRSFFLHPFPGTRPMPYMGSPSTTPVFRRVGDLLMEQQAWTQTNDRLIRVGVEGHEVAVPTDRAFQLPSPDQDRMIVLPDTELRDVPSHLI